MIKQQGGIIGHLNQAAQNRPDRMPSITYNDDFCMETLTTNAKYMRCQHCGAPNQLIDQGFRTKLVGNMVAKKYNILNYKNHDLQPEDYLKQLIAEYETDKCTVLRCGVCNADLLSCIQEHVNVMIEIIIHDDIVTWYSIGMLE